MMIDSNIIIYAAQPKFRMLRKFVREHEPAVSAVSVVEVLGYHRLDQRDKGFFENFFKSTEVLPVSDEVIGRAVRLRQNRKMDLADALIAGTATVFGHTLATRNVRHFAGIQGLKVLDPFTSSEGAQQSH